MAVLISSEYKSMLQHAPKEEVAADGRASSGKATLVKESGDWKLDEDAWATPTK